MTNFTCVSLCAWSSTGKCLFMRASCACQSFSRFCHSLIWLWETGFKMKMYECIVRKCLSLLIVSFVCLPSCQSEERRQLSWVRAIPQRALQSSSNSVGICDCWWTDKMALGQRFMLRQAAIWHRTDGYCLKALSGTKATLLKLNTGA